MDKLYELEGKLKERLDYVDFLLEENNEISLEDLINEVGFNMIRIDGNKVGYSEDTISNEDYGDISYPIDTKVNVLSIYEDEDGFTCADCELV